MCIFLSCQSKTGTKGNEKLKLGSSIVQYTLNNLGNFHNTMTITNDYEYKIIWNDGLFKSMIQTKNGESDTLKLKFYEAKGYQFFNTKNQFVEYPFKNEDSLNLFFFEKLSIIGKLDSISRTNNVSFRNVIPTNFMVMYKGIKNEKFSDFDQNIQFDLNDNCDSIFFNIGVYYSNKVKFKEKIILVK